MTEQRRQNIVQKQVGCLSDWQEGRRVKGQEKGQVICVLYLPGYLPPFISALTLSHQKALTLCMGRKQTVQFLSIGLLSPAELGAERKEWGGSVLLPKLDCVDAFFFLIVV